MAKEVRFKYSFLLLIHEGVNTIVNHSIDKKVGDS